jgi:hypothetical protein
MAPPVLTLALDENEWLASRPGHFISEKEALVAHWVGGWVGFRVNLDAVKKR